MSRESRALDYPIVLSERDTTRVATSYTVAESGCWIARNVPHTRGYSSIVIAHQRLQLHRLMFVLTRGPLPATWDIDHLCRTPRCVNPAHLEAVSPAENVRRGDFSHPRKARAA